MSWVLEFSVWWAEARLDVTLGKQAIWLVQGQDSGTEKGEDLNKETVSSIQLKGAHDLSPKDEIQWDRLH